MESRQGGRITTETVTRFYEGTEIPVKFTKEEDDKINEILKRAGRPKKKYKLDIRFPCPFDTMLLDIGRY